MCPLHCIDFDLSGDYGRIFLRHCRSGNCFEKSSETLVLEKMHASASSAAGRQKQAAPPLSSFGGGRQRSVGAPLSMVDAQQQPKQQGLQPERHLVGSNGYPPSAEVDSAEPHNCTDTLQHASLQVDSMCAGQERAAPMAGTLTQPQDANRASINGPLDQDSKAYLDSVDCLDLE